MSDEIICLSSSDDEDACIETSSKIRPKSKVATQKRRLSNSSFEGIIEAKKPKIDNGVIVLDEYEEDSKPKRNFNSSNKKSVKFQNPISKSQNEWARKRSPSPIAGTSKYFDLIENQVPKKGTHDIQEKKLPSLVPQNSNISKKVSHDKPEEKCSTPIRENNFKRIKPQLVVKKKVAIPDSTDVILDKIFQTCRTKTDRNIEIPLQKVKAYCDQLELYDKDCEDFRNFLSSCLNQIINGDKYFKFLQDIKDEAVRRIMQKNKNKRNEQIDQDKVSTESEERELTEDEARKVKILEATIRKCKQKIETFENEEVDFDEEENSSYLKVDRYKKKIIELCDELSRIAKDKMLRNQIHKKLLRRKDISDEMTGIIYVDDAIIRFVNASIKKANELKHIKNPNAVASYLFMPDYVDILQCIKTCNEERKLQLKNRKMEKLAEKAFKAVGNYLKNQRLRETSEYLSSYVGSSEGDPAKNNFDLLKKLKSNKEVGVKNLEGIFAKYVAKQEGLTSEDSDSKDDSCEDESNEEDNSTDKNEVNSSSRNEDNSGDEGDSFKRVKRSVSKNKMIPTISSDEMEETVKTVKIAEPVETVETVKIAEPVETVETVKIAEPSKTVAAVEIAEPVKNVETVEMKELVETIEIEEPVKAVETEVPVETVEIEEPVEVNETSKESHESDKNELNKENIDNAKSNALEGTSNTKKLTNSTDMARSINNDDQVEEKTQPSKKIIEAVTILSEICEVSNSLSSDKNKSRCELVDDEIEILSDTSDKSKKKREELDNDSSQDIVLEIEDEDPLIITEDDSTDNRTSISDINCAKEEKKRKIEGEKFSNHEVQNKKIAVSKYSNKRSTVEKDSKNDSGNNSSNTVNENSIKDMKKAANIGTVYPLQARDNQEKLVTELGPSIITEENRKKNKEFHITSNEKASSADKTLVETKDSPFLKVKSFAKPPESWKDTSPEKPAKNLKLSIQQVLQQMSKPECVDLTNENENRSSSTRFINPLAVKKHRLPVNKLVVVKNVVNNFNISLPTDGVRGNNKNVPINKVQLVNPQVKKSFLVPKASSVQVNQVPPNNHNQRSTDTSIVRMPFVSLPSTKKKNDNSHSSSTVK